MVYSSRLNNSPLFSQNRYYGSLEWANNQLRAAIEFLKEGHASEGFWLWNQRLAAALLLKKELEEKGFFWQSKRIENQIHRLQPRRVDLKKEERSLP